jgi:hypothetical protein
MTRDIIYRVGIAHPIFLDFKFLNPALIQNSPIIYLHFAIIILYVLNANFVMLTDELLAKEDYFCGLK